MFAAAMLSLAIALTGSSDTACPGLDAPSATTSERRAALDLCAREANKPALDYLLDASSRLTPRDARASYYGDVVSAWSVDELVAAVPRLIEMSRSASSASDATRIVAIRAILALPADKRPPEAAAFAPMSVDISTIPSRMAYDKKEFRVAPGQVVKVNFHNPDALEHNLLIVAPGALAEIGIAGDRMGQNPDGKLKEYVPDSVKVLAVMGIVAPGASREFWFIAPSVAGTYPYVCTYPQHWRMMNGKLKVVAPEKAIKAPELSPPKEPS